jgi:YjbE family integral membrane protein
VGAHSALLELLPWQDWLRAAIENAETAGFWLALAQIVLVNILLSGDNAVVIAMACRDLPARHRMWGLIAGSGVAILLRIVFAALVTEVMRLSFLKLLGGAALFLIAAKLLGPDEEDRDEVTAAAHLWRAIAIIAVADLVMSLDNVIALAALANGNLLLLVVGLVLSIPLIAGGAALIVRLIDRAPIIVWAGAGLLGWIAGGVMADDPAVIGFITRRFGVSLIGPVHFAAAVSGVVLALALGGLWRRLREIQIAKAQLVADA